MLGRHVSQRALMDVIKYRCTEEGSDEERICMTEGKENNFRFKRKCAFIFIYLRREIFCLNLIYAFFF